MGEALVIGVVLVLILTVLLCCNKLLGLCERIPGPIKAQQKRDVQVIERQRRREASIDKEESNILKHEKKRAKKVSRIGSYSPYECVAIHSSSGLVEDHSNDVAQKAVQRDPRSILRNAQAISDVATLFVKRLRASLIRDSQSARALIDAVTSENRFLTLIDQDQGKSIKFIKLTRKKIKTSLTSSVGHRLDDGTISKIYDILLDDIKSDCTIDVLAFVLTNSNRKNAELPDKMYFGFLVASFDRTAGVVQVHELTYGYKIFVVHEMGEGSKALQLSLEEEETLLSDSDTDSDDGAGSLRLRNSQLLLS